MKGLTWREKLITSTLAQGNVWGSLVRLKMDGFAVFFSYFHTKAISSNDYGKWVCFKNDQLSSRD